MTAFGSDGARVMTGSKNGVAVKLKQEVSNSYKIKSKNDLTAFFFQSPELVANHCVAHREALAIKGVTEDIPLLKKFCKTLENIHNFYERSAVRMAKLKDIQVSSVEIMMIE